jgi:hypothetical protein
MPVRRQLWPVIAGTTLLAAGCTISAATSSFTGDSADFPPSNADSDAASGYGGFQSADATVKVDASTAPVTGSPLCRDWASLHECDPESDNKILDGGSTATLTCTALVDVIDGGDAGPFACHITKVDGDARPTCYPEGNSRDYCASAASCAAGYECVGADNGACRRFCCDPNACDSTSFCDVQALFHATDVKIPVCMPITPCKLLTDACPNQTCSVVDPQRGVTSCVDIGPRGVGAECETDHCAKDLQCLGTIGSRKCFKLCDLLSGNDAYQCPSGERCKTNTLTFPSADVGICE